MRLKLLLAATACMLSLGTVGAKADTVQFTVVDTDIVGPNTLVNTVTFDVPESPTPSKVLPNGFELNVPITGTTTDNGVLSGKFSPTETLFFYSTLVADVDGYFSNGLTGYYTGSYTDPTFVPGTYGTAGDSVTITDITAAVPETSTWAMMILGFCGIGFMTYRKQRHSVRVA